MSVFANGLEVSGKATPNKTIAAMPDVCMSPPPPPAGPVPIPYPLTGMASDTTDGCTSVFVKGKEAGKKNASKYSKTTGDEPATNSFGAGIITHKITGPLKFAAYSFDVIFEGGGAERFTDLTTQNHMNAGDGSMGASGAGAAPPSPPEDLECAAMRAELDNDRVAALQNPGDASPQEIACSTVASGRADPGGMTYASSSEVVAERLTQSTPRNYSSPTPSSQGRRWRGQQPYGSRACGGNPMIVHETGRGGRHAEMKILDRIDWSNPPSTISFCVSYPGYSSAGWEPDLPCPTCEETLREVCACVREIYICDANSNEPKPVCNPE